jgi:hypothetical protein
MDISSTIILSVSSGILTAALLCVLGKLFYNVIIPWYQKIIYKGVDLVGGWEQEIPESEGSSHFQLTLKQNANNISGNMAYTRKKDSGETRILYDVSGSVWEGFITLNFNSLDRKKVAFATALLKVKHGGSKLSGNLSYRNFNIDDVDSVSICLARKIER